MPGHTLTAVLLITIYSAVTAVSADGPAPPLPEPISIAYGEHPRQSLDLYPCPTADAHAPAALVLYFHGGGFNHGDKSKVSPNLIKRMHDKSISVASVNYRFVTTDPLPAAMRDGARAIQHLRHHAVEYRLDPARFAVLGSSAGAGIALWVALHDDLADPEAEDPVAQQSSRVVCVYVKNAQVSYDPRFWRELGLTRVFERRTFHELYHFPDDAGDHPEGEPALQALFAQASPITHLTADDPPVRLDYGFGIELNDRTPMSALIHHPLHGEAFAKACQPLAVECLLTYPGGPQLEETGYSYLIRKLAPSPEP